jgi:hypothetical protein
MDPGASRLRPVSKKDLLGPPVGDAFYAGRRWFLFKRAAEYVLESGCLNLPARNWSLLRQDESRVRAYSYAPLARPSISRPDN